MIVTFSDGTIAGYVVEELLELRPQREHIEQPAPTIAPEAATPELQLLRGFLPLRLLPFGFSALHLFFGDGECLVYGIPEAFGVGVARHGGSG
ncbi:MAG: hypothetical protein ABSD67_14750 [Terracidiphilus sp.]|jgi:hypothetical protein